MAWTEQDKQKMDNAAIDAQNELVDMENVDEHFSFVAAWWDRHYQKAGHKRLAHILLEYAPKAPEPVYNPATKRFENNHEEK